MYESPINLTFINDIVSEIHKKQEDAVMCEIKKAIGIDIDKEELMRALQYDRQQYEKGYIDGLNADKWIYCDDKEPEVNRSYLTLHEDGKMNVGAWTNWGWMFEMYVKDVIAWQPLPSPPKEK